MKTEAPIVRCAFKEIVKVEELTPHPLNPNNHPPKQIEMFIEILKYSGCRRAVTVSRQSGFITKGHGLVQAYIEAGWPEVPVDYQDYEDEASELADMVADNELAKMAELNTGKLQEIGIQLDTGLFNMQLTGIPEAKLEKLMTVAKAPEPKLEGIDGAPEAMEGDQYQDGMGGTVSGDKPSPSHVRMVQLFFNEETQSEFMQIADFFQQKYELENVTDTVLEVMRAAYRSHQELEGEDTSANSPDIPASEG